MSRSVTIGSRPDCDLVVNVPTVSGRHCRLTRDGASYILEDLGSTNGTYLNGERVAGRVTTRLDAADTLHLGSHALALDQVRTLLGPEPAPFVTLKGMEMVIGRTNGCDHVIDLPMISSRHARLFRSADRVLIEDLGSSNGTFVNGRRIDRPIELRPADVIGLGSYTLSLDPALWNEDKLQDRLEPRRPAPAAAGQVAATLSAATPAAAPAKSEMAAILSHPWRLVALTAQAPVAAILISSLLVARFPAPMLFWLSLAAVWFGLSNAAFGELVPAAWLRLSSRPSHMSTLVTRLIVLADLCLVQCLLLWIMVAGGSSLQAPAVPAIALLFLDSAIGLCLGLLIVGLTHRPEVGWALTVIVLIPLGLLGGQWTPLHRLPPAIRALSGFVPTRWTFEGLLLLESYQQPVTVSAPESESAAGRDVAEEFFPAETDRMGVKADALALVTMLIGLAGAVVFISVSSRTDLWPPPAR
jgi:pSer/pThr/pTyr-binding forkhead associated (FHA) protein